MNTFTKTALALTTVGALTVAAIAPSAAQGRRAWQAAGVGFAAGALVGAAAANAGPRYYGSAYSYGPTYTDGYASEPDYYEPAPTYYRPAYPVYGGNVGSPNYNPYVCSSDEGYGRRGSCDSR